MKQSCLLFSVVLLFAVPGIFGECVIESVQGIPQYMCNSLQDLEDQGNSNAFDVSINKPSDTSNRILHIKVVLLEDTASDEISPEIIKFLKDIASFLKDNHEVGTLSARFFVNLPIKELELQHNGITNIELGAFSTLGKLQRLFVVDNRLSIVKNGLFNNLPVRILALSRNRISHIEKDAFKGMSKLNQLHLDGNLLSEFQPEVIMSHPQVLQELLLQNNYITDLDRNILKGLSNLKYLNLDRNKISRCLAYTFDEISNIEVLALGNNLLQELKSESFPTNGLQKLQKLYIHNNRLSFLTTLVLEKLSKLEHIRFAGNPWQCPCLEALLTWLYDHRVQQKCDQDYFNGTRPVCVVNEVHPLRCVYENDSSNYQKFRETNDKSPQNVECLL